MKQIGKILFLISITFISCQKEADTPDNFSLVYPSYFPEPHYQFETNKLSREGFLLGRKLFFDPMLSNDNTISCASCHAPQDFFVDLNASISSGVQGRQGVRHAPTLVNMIWNTSFMWDGGVNHIEVSGLPALTDPNEMNDTLPNIIAKLQQHSEYPTLFQEVFQKDSIDDQQLFYALTQYVGSIISATSKYDLYKQNKAELTSNELAGYQVFKTNCSQCHKEPLFTDFSFRNNGLDDNFDDLGRERITLNSSDKGKFKVPTLRNVMHTAPYMHDGRLSNIDDVLDHYLNHVIQSPTLDPLLQNGIQLSQTEQENLKLFLHTLTDDALRNNSLFYEP